MEQEQERGSEVIIFSFLTKLVGGFSAGCKYRGFGTVSLRGKKAHVVEASVHNHGRIQSEPDPETAFVRHKEKMVVKKVGLCDTKTNSNWQAAVISTL